MIYGFKKNILTLIITLIIMYPWNCYPCSAIIQKFNDRFLIGRNMDWRGGLSYFLVKNSKGKKRVEKNSQHLVTWQSQYSTVAIHMPKDYDPLQWDPGSVIAGFNEKGLSVVSLWLAQTQYPKDLKVKSIHSGRWVQYLLDNAKDVAEAIAFTRKINVAPSSYGGQEVLLHLLISDSKGNIAIMEYLEGQLIIQQKDITVFANNTFSKTMELLLGKNIPEPSDRNKSESRILRARAMLDTLDRVALTSNSQAIDVMFSILDEVSQTEKSAYPTRWSVVLDPTSQTVAFKNFEMGNAPVVRKINVSFVGNESETVLNL
jgi:choloylglycine hydrolase